MKPTCTCVIGAPPPSLIPTPSLLLASIERRRRRCLKSSRYARSAGGQRCVFSHLSYLFREVVWPRKRAGVGADPSTRWDEAKTASRKPGGGDSEPLPAGRDIEVHAIAITRPSSFCFSIFPSTPFSCAPILHLIHPSLHPIAASLTLLRSTARCRPLTMSSSPQAPLSPSLSP